MELKSDKSKVFFNDPKNYLTSNVLIELRRIIIQDLIGTSKNKNLLDIGCGNGDLTRSLVDNNRITYLDVSPNMIELVKSKLSETQLQRCTFINSDFEGSTFNDKFDIIVCVGVIAHVEDIGKLLNRINSITSDNAQIIIQYTAAEKMLAKFNRIKAKVLNSDRYNYKINITRSKDIKRYLDLNKFVTEKKINYIPISPLLSLFNSEQKFKLLKRFLHGKLFKTIGSEIILCLKKKN